MNSRNKCPDGSFLCISRERISQKQSLISFRNHGSFRAQVFRFLSKKKQTNKTSGNAKEKDDKDVNAEAKLDEFETAADTSLCENL